MAVNPGNSGGPVIAASGKVIAVIVNKLIDTKEEISKKLENLKAFAGMLTMTDPGTSVDIAGAIAEAFEFTVETSQLVIGGAIKGSLVKTFVDAAVKSL